MSSYCLKCRKNTDSKQKIGKPILLSKCALCGSKKSRFFNQQEASGLLSHYGVRTSSVQISLVGPFLS